MENEWVHCHCLQHLLVWFHQRWEGPFFVLSSGGGGVSFVVSNRRGPKISTWCVLSSIQCCFTCCIFICDYLLKLIRPHARAVEILCGRHLMMNVYDFLSCCSLKKKNNPLIHEAECQIPSSIFLSFIPISFQTKRKKKKGSRKTALLSASLSLLLVKSIGDALLVMKALSMHQWSLI